MAIQRKLFIPGAETTVVDVIKFIDNCYDPVLLRNIGKLAFSRIRGEITEMRRRQYSIGDQVSFYSKKSGTLYGEIVVINRVRLNAPTKPHATPINANIIPWPITIRKTSLGCAPIAMRMPISCVRCVTVYDITP